MRGTHPAALRGGRTIVAELLQDALLPVREVGVHAEGGALQRESLVDGLPDQPLRIGIVVVAVPLNGGPDPAVHLHGDGDIPEGLGPEIRHPVEYRLTGRIVARRVDAAVVFAPLADSETADEGRDVGIVELLREGPHELGIALLEGRIVGIGRPDTRRGSGRRPVDLTPRSLDLLADILGDDVVVVVAAVGRKVEDEFQPALPGPLHQHAQTLGLFGIDPLVPDVNAAFGVGIRPAHADQQHRGVVRHLDIPLGDGRTGQMVVLHPIVVGQAVAQTGVEHPAREGIAQHRLAVGRHRHLNPLDLLCGAAVAAVVRLRAAADGDQDRQSAPH